MSILSEIRPSDTPYVASVVRGWTVSAGSSIRPAENCWHLVFARFQDRVHPIFVGPLSTAGTASWGEGAEILWIKFKLGVFLRQLPLTDFLDTEQPLPEAGSRSFWLNGSAWQFPDFENADTFVERLVREDVLASDPVVSAVLQGHPVEMSPRTVRHRFLRATGLTRSRIVQIERAQQAAALLQEGVPILDVVFELGYYDQPHLTHSLKQWVGKTPAQIYNATKHEATEA